MAIGTTNRPGRQCGPAQTGGPGSRSTSSRRPANDDVLEGGGSSPAGFCARPASVNGSGPQAIEGAVPQGCYLGPGEVLSRRVVCATWWVGTFSSARVLFIESHGAHALGPRPGSHTIPCLESWDERVREWARPSAAVCSGTTWLDYEAGDHDGKKT